MDVRLRLSLVVRMAVATVIVASLSFWVALFTGVLGSALLLGVVGWIPSKVATFALEAPRLSAVLGIHPGIVAVAALAALWLVYVGWQRVAPRARDDYLFPPSDLPQWLLVLVCLGALYSLLVEAAAAITLAVLAVLSPFSLGILVLAIGFLLGIYGFVSGVKKTIRRLQERSISEAVPADEVDDRLPEVVARLARQGSVPAPAVQVTPRDRPEAFTIGSGSSAILVVSEGLLDVLPDDELEAVLAHEVSHLANGDSRVMATAIAPIVYAEGLYIDEHPDDPGDVVFNLFVRMALRYGEFGVAFLSRGREWAADAGAAELTGNPAALASALARLDDEHGVPQEDPREWSEAYAALDIVPTLDPDGRAFPFRTHPSTQDRIERLQRLATELESKGSAATNS
ncbi:M48 family metallopeptidase [Haloarchaeobius amylolyticus]|uniref:M48 family metallopeptidase n=1 Tax=Haloarchaeobius amylolyticus TaxID=1198296 RepID=UPI00226F19DD|nr:M48 family metalloprotease [Haloarchaeobius amylolyticus]